MKADRPWAELIHGPDGAKMSKRHGALGVDAYRDQGFLPEAMRNYLLRLGWAHGDEEIISTEQAIEWFNLESVGRSASRFDFVKLTNLNGHYMRNGDDSALAELIAPSIAKKRGKDLDNEDMNLLERVMPGLKERAKNVHELADSAQFYFSKAPLEFTDKALAQLTEDGCSHLNQLSSEFSELATWDAQSIEAHVRAYSERPDPAIKLGKIAQPLRAALSGSTVSPPIFDVMALLGRDETLTRINEAIKLQG